MANPEHLGILHQGIEEWNKWRKDNPEVIPDLSKAKLTGTRLMEAELWKVDLSDADLTKVNLSRANLIEANLSRANLIEANLGGAYLMSANLSQSNIYSAILFDANLSNADLSDADLSDTDLSDSHLSEANLCRASFSDVDLSGSDLSGANLRKADLRRANLKMANLNNANLCETNLNEANLSRADLSGADLSNAQLIETNFNRAYMDSTSLKDVICSLTIFTDIDMSTTKGLGTVHHHSSSIVGVETLFKSKGKIPEIFLRGCGIPETLITFLPSMLEDAIQFFSCFISYSHVDKEFAKRLHDRLQGIGIRCWLDEHQLNPGDKLHTTIYEAIRVYDKVILCCSETALTSWWVEKEFENVMAKEEDYQEGVLIPLTLDNFLFEQSQDKWLIGEIKKRLVQPFQNWKDHDAFEKSFKSIVKALRTDGGKPPKPEPKLTPRKR